MQVRHGLEDLLSAAPEPDVLERWEKAVATHTATARYSLPSVLLDQVVPDFARAQRDLTARYPARHHRQVAHILARLAGIIAYGLMGMAQHKESDAWARTAGTLAAECGDRQLGAWVLARLAMTQFELGSLNTCLAWSRAARLVARDRPCGGVAWAWATESYALARMGRTAEARTALRRTEDLFSRQPTDRESPLFGYGPRTQHMIETTAYARLGDVDRTWAAVAGTHRTLPADHHPVVRSWPDLHLALSLGVATDYRAACEAATRILHDVEGHPVARRIQTGAREILDLLPDGHRDRPYARELRALVRAGGRGA